MTPTKVGIFLFAEIDVALIAAHSAVGGCGLHDPEDPGNLQLDWLEVQIKTYRNRNMQAGFFVNHMI